MTQERFEELFAAAMAAYRAEENRRSVSEWAESAWRKAVDQGVFDGSKPGGTMTREMAAVVLDRLDRLGGAV